MSFDYSKSGLPENPKWRLATEMCNAWLTQNMAMFGPERIASFMTNQPVAAARRILDNCPDATEESITLALLGPAKPSIAADKSVEVMAEKLFGDRTLGLLRTLMDPRNAKDQEMIRDVNRLFMVEGISSMTDQMIGRARIDQHHQVRLKMLSNFERHFTQIRGDDPALDDLFEAALKQSRASLAALENQPPKPQPPKPPGR